MKSHILHPDYTGNGSPNQAPPPLNLSVVIASDDSVRLVSNLVDEMDLAPLYDTYESGRKRPYPPDVLLKIVLYGYMNGIWSSRGIEKACLRDVNFMFLLEGLPAPDHATIARFRSSNFAECSERMLAEMSRLLKDLEEIGARDVYIDGTKLESVANKYTFVWKKGVLKNREKLWGKLPPLIEELRDEYGWRLDLKEEASGSELKAVLEMLDQERSVRGIAFVQGRGHRKTKLQRHFETVSELTERLVWYETALEICGERNSFSKTDPDATFMRMKEDAMGNGQLKPAYNIQHGVDSEYVVWVSVESSPTDTPTLIPFMRDMERSLGFKYTNVVADAGYESEENYKWLEERGYEAYVKPSNYEISKTRKYRNDIGRAENMKYDEASDAYVCAAGKELAFVRTASRRTKSGYAREYRIYECADCGGCELKAACIKAGRSKTPLEERSKRLQVSRTFDGYRRKARERIVSDEGNLLRMNRSVQAEGSFGQLKNNVGFRRFVCRGSVKVQAELTLFALAGNVNKLHRKIQGGRLGTHNFPLKEDVA